MGDVKTEELVRMYRMELTQKENEFKENLKKEQRKFIEEVESSGGESKSAYYEDLYNGLNNGTYDVPSQFVKKKLGWIFEGYIYKRYQDALCYVLDHSVDWAYASSYYRRSFRSPDYYMDNMLGIIRAFHQQMTIDRDLADILHLNLSEQEKVYFLSNTDWNPHGCGELALAYELDQKNARVEEAVEDIINGDSEVVLQRFIIRGIVKSNNAKMHELLGKLLLAARLQEGLRQSICENMDIGTVAAFKTLLQVVDENNLIRFSSVKRAVGTWLGIIDQDVKDLERISGKSIKLIIDCLGDRSLAQELIHTEDCMNIYIGLWSIGVSNIKDAIDLVKELSKNGTHHQVLTTGYFCANLNNNKLAHELAKGVIREHSLEQDILAVYIKYFMGEEVYYNYKERNARDNMSKYFDSKKETQEFYDIFLEIYQGISGKGVDFSPCIFPWYSASLQKTVVIERLCRLAKMLKSQEKMDFVCGLLKDCEASNRGRCVSILLEKPATPIQKETVTAMLCDRESWTRRTATEIVEKMEIEEANYLQMEAMLRYKAADMRASIIGFLYQQSDEKIEGSIERLLGDSKEEKRTAGLDLVLQLSRDEKRKKVYTRCIKYVEKIENPTSKEKVLIDNVLGNGENEAGENETLYQKTDRYVPEVVEGEFLQKSIDTFMEYFPDSKIREQIAGSVSKQTVFGKLKEKIKRTDDTLLESVKKDCASLHDLFVAHKEDEYQGYSGESFTFGAASAQFREKLADGKFEIPGLAIWKEWYEKEINDYVRLFRMYILLQAHGKGMDFDDAVRPYIVQIFGAGFEEEQEYEFSGRIRQIIDRLMEDYCEEEAKYFLSAALGYWYIKCLPQEKVLLKAIPPQRALSYHQEREAHFISHSQLSLLFARINCRNNFCFKELFPLSVAIADKTFAREVKREESSRIYYTTRDTGVVSPCFYSSDGAYSEPGTVPYLLAAYYNIITKEEMYEHMFREKNISASFRDVTLLASAIKEQGRQIAKRGGYGWWRDHQKKYLMEAIGDDLEFKRFICDVYEELVREVLNKELKRGDSETIYSEHITDIRRIYGIDNLIAILTAMGKDTLERSTYYFSKSKKGSMSHLLSVCIPRDEDTVDELKNALAKTDITDTRLIEAALYSPEWMDMVGEYLGYEGFKSTCYYFMAHMNEKFDDKRKAVIAKYTPLSEEELNDGAFDMNWFKNAYETMGKRRFDTIYKAAKYISDGSKHSRARKYADATLGKMERDDVEGKISDKRNKDLVMAYSLIPLKNEDDIIRRYLFLQNFLKESKKFGAQRIASEKKAAEISLGNLAMNAGYSDVTRLTLRMETKLIDDIRDLFEEKEIDEINVRLQVGEDGKPEIICVKAGKRLKSIPAKYKKNEYIVRLNESKKKLTEQFKRTKRMFEEAMEEETEFTVEEMKILFDNPVVNAIVKNLVFMCGSNLGFLEGNKLTNYAGKVETLADKDKVVVAHPYHIYRDGHWSEYQKTLFDRQIRQVFKQVFRELYVKTEEELEMNYSRRYSGNQIQPQKTVACLKGRRWVADVEDGLQKVYYKENIIARIYALADWFSPSDIEAPTLEWVEFSDRKTGKQIKIQEIPDVIFSEIMRDVDLAVSVAHAGGVDPETSHSTVEMRAALLSFTLPLFKLENVKINKNHAIVTGSYGTYDINLGSGVIHKQGGAMIHVLPVHSQHRGKIFLPFADDDPKTAEIITKVIMFAEDKKIKDVSILEQIR